MGPLTSIALSLALHPAQLPAGAWTDVELRLAFVNHVSRPVALHAAVAEPWIASGWGSPAFELEVTREGGPAPRWIELRTWYGPPGEPPAAAFFQRGKITLRPGAQHVHVLRGCWLPRRTLAPGQLEPGTLDPEGMDGLAARLAGAPLAEASVLVLGATCAELRPRAADPELLRGSRLGFFFGPGAYRVRARYRQAPWVDFRPAASLDVTSDWSELGVTAR